MKSIFIPLALVCATAIARADLVIQQQITVKTNNSVATMKIKGSKVRLDMYVGQPQAISRITDLNTGDILLLLHTQKMFVKTSGSKTKSNKPSGNNTTLTTARSPVPQATGKTQKVGNYDTELYTWSNSRGITGTAWVAKNFPDYSKIKADLAVLDKAFDGGDDVMNPAVSTLPGMVVRSQVAGSGQTITVALISAKEEPVDASLFQIPANYKEMMKAKPLKTNVAQPVPPKPPGK